MKRVILASILLLAFGCGNNNAEFGSYSIGRDCSWFPLNIGAQRATQLVAFTNALVQEMSKVEKVPLNLISFDWSQLFESLDEGKVAGIFTSLSPTVITKGTYSFSNPFLLLGPVLVVPAHSQATSLADLSGKIVAVNQFDESILIVQRTPTILIQLYQNNAIALEALAKGEYDALLMPVLDAKELIPQLYASQLKIVSDPLNDKGLRLITLKDKYPALIQHFNQGLAKLSSSGNYAALRKKLL